MDSPVTRREFLGTSSKAAAGVAAGAAVHTLLREARAAEANEKFTIALVGCGGMGSFKLGNFMASEQCDLAAVCDIDDAQMDRALAKVQDKLTTPPKKVKDYRQVLAMPEVDIVIVATPDHWHAPIMMAAVADGKHVYCEKPCSHNIREAQLMVQAAEKYKKVVQVGTHQRSITHIQEAREYLQAGTLGVISQTQTYIYGNDAMKGMGDAPDEPVPAGVDYDRWLGPAPEQPFNRRRFHGSWRWYFDYAAGMVGDWNVHLQDIVMWTMDVTAPVAVTTTGGKYVLTDDRTTPDTMQTVYEFASSPLAPKGFSQTFTMRKASGKPWNRGGYGMDFFGTNGFAHLDRSQFRVDPDEVNWKSDKTKRTDKVRKRSDGDKQGHADHVLDFLQCIRTGETPVASIEKHYQTVVACHLANVSYKVQRQIFWDADKVSCFKDRGLTIPDAEANGYLGRAYRKGYALPNVL